MEPSFLFKNLKLGAKGKENEAAIPDAAAVHIEEAARVLVDQARGARDFASTYGGGFGVSREAGDAAYRTAESYMRTAEKLLVMIGRPVGYACVLRDQLDRQAQVAATTAPAPATS